MLRQFAEWQFRRGELASMADDVETWKDACDAELDAYKALALLAAERW